MEDKITITEQSFQRLEEKETEQVTGYRHSVWKEIRKEFLSNKAALFSMVFLSVILIAVLLAPLSRMTHTKSTFLRRCRACQRATSLGRMIMEEIT